MERKKKMSYPYWEYNDSKREFTLYFGELNYVTYYDDDGESLYRDLENANSKDREFILNELYLDMEHTDPYRR
tara:strand:+ start:36 stop:254 length:219 start_codon:yes stop_codon:yes gene_type:complete